jgi:hypothetical protein
LTKQAIKYCIIIILSLFAHKAIAQQYTEYDLKAAYIYNFSKFVSWPIQAFETDTEDFKIVVFGDSPITKVLLKALKNRKILNREISIKVIYRIKDLEDAHILFVSKLMQHQSKEIIDLCESKSILVVGDVIENFCQLGGTINFTRKSSKYRFEINNQSAKESGLKISSKLLALARIISSEEIKF